MENNKTDITVTSCECTEFIPKETVSTLGETKGNEIGYHGDIPTTVSVVGIALGTILTTLSAPLVVGVGAALIITGTALPLFWKYQIDDDIWKDIYNHLHKLTEKIDQEIDENNYKSANAGLSGLYEGLINFSKDFKLWKESKMTVSDIKAKYFSLETYYSIYMKKIQDGPSQIILLPIFAQAAFSHISFLNISYDYADEWGFSKEHKERILENIQENIKKYIDYAIDKYREGLKKIRENKEENWIKYNEFRVINTMLVLDWISLLPRMNQYIYPGKVEFFPYNRSLSGLLITRNDDIKIEYNNCTVNIKTIEEEIKCSDISGSTEDNPKDPICMYTFESTKNKPEPIKILERISLYNESKSIEVCDYPMAGKGLLNGLSDISRSWKSIDGFNISISKQPAYDNQRGVRNLLGILEGLKNDPITAISGSYYNENSRIESGRGHFIIGTICDLNVYKKIPLSLLKIIQLD
ncbi:insecticidal delta-endotoxin Cry8Ea1 family protein [Xenorhabdus bovienii]|uniref:insecticidal delta-endotoxin Cry8Ea1 family protein n=1 Tax=Xenorhabdus bovienii TaxID=40576 RepID=UPI0023B30CC0|nr:insecticidal delta-endotoxin Cry8Ea1 family protein [Xenorhabdus bovienii]MDE9536890.1 hypothetical protein [Xenorhabdus bovienii]MDE9589901.1 hypothetical protein [Xenorhabdus bovienii]